MKTIEVSDEMHEFLMNLSNELNTQDHRGTRMPYFFQVQTQEVQYVPDGCGIEVWVCDGATLETDEEIKEEVIRYKEWDTLEEEDAEKRFAELDRWEVKEIMEENWRKVDMDHESRYENAFLTSKACDEHIMVNKHNLHSPVNYLSGSFRNPELEMVMKFLCELSGGKLHT